MLSCVTAIVSGAVDDSNGSTGPSTTPVPTKKSGIPVIVNVNQDSRNIEKTIKSLETTLEKNFQQLISVINSTFGGNRPEKPGKICLIMFRLWCFINYKFFWSVLNSIVFWVDSSFSSCKEIYVNHK